MSILDGIKTKYNLLNSMMKVSFWYTFSNFMQKFVVVLSVPVITRMISATEYGMYSVYGAWFEIIYNMCTLALASGGYYVGMKKHSDKKEKYDSSICTLCFCITSVCFLFFKLFPGIWGNLFAIPISYQLPMFVGIVLGCPRDYWAAGERYKLRYKKLVFITLITSLGVLATQVICIKIAPVFKITDDLAVIWGGVIPSAVVGIPILISIIVKGQYLFDSEIWKETIQFNVILIPYYMSITLLNQIDRVMIEQFVDAAHAGYYSVAYRAASTINILTVALNQTLMPWIFQKLERCEEKEIRNVSSIIFIIPFVICLFIILLAPEIIFLLSGREYLVASSIIPSVAIGMCLRFVSQTFINVEMYYEKNKLITISTISVALLNVLLNWLLIPRFGFIWAGYTTLICFLIQAIIQSCIVSNVLHIGYIFNLRYIWACIVITIILGIVLESFYDLLIIRYIIFVFILISIFLKREIILLEITKIIKNKFRGIQ